MFGLLRKKTGRRSPAQERRLAAIAGLSHSATDIHPDTAGFAQADPTPPPYFQPEITPPPFPDQPQDAPPVKPAPMVYQPQKARQNALGHRLVSRSMFSPARLIALFFFLISAALALLSLQVGLPATETGLLCLLTAVAAAIVLKSLPAQQDIARGMFALATGGFICLAALVLLPAANLWPSGAGPLIFSLIFAVTGTLARSKSCLALSAAALFGLMIDSDGLTRMRLDGQIATFALFAVGLCGSILSASRIMASISLIAVMASALTLMASFGIPTPGALSILSVLALVIALALRAYGQQGHSVAEIPMILSAIIFATSAIAFQLFLMGAVTDQADYFVEPMPKLGVMILICLQGMVLFVSLISWLSRRMSLTDLLLTQAAFGLACTLIADPLRLGRLGLNAPASILAALVGLVVIVFAVMALIRAWKDDRAILTAISALIVMIQIVFALRIVTGTFDIALGALVCAGLAVGLAVMMALNPRHIPHSRFA
jgi:hypothetical protein